MYMYLIGKIDYYDILQDICEGIPDKTVKSDYLENQIFRTPSGTHLCQSCLTVFDSMDYAACQAPLSMKILQTRTLAWVALPSSRGSSLSRDRAQVSQVAGRFFTV